jgi:hypothetical protein
MSSKDSIYQMDQHYAQTFVYGGHDPGHAADSWDFYCCLGIQTALQLSQEALVLGWISRTGKPSRGP